MSYIYLSDKVNAFKSGAPESVDTMSNIFKKNLIEVAESLEDNCHSPVIKITSPLATENASGGSITINDYAGNGKVVQFEVSDIGGDSNEDGVDEGGYDKSKTSFRYKLITRYFNGSAGALPTVDEDIIPESGKNYINVSTPYRDFQYELHVYATNQFGKEVEKIYNVLIDKNRKLSVEVKNKVCSYDSDGYRTGLMSYEFQVSDDEYANNYSSTSSLSERSVVLEFKDSAHTINKEVVNICSIEKPVYRVEIWKTCQWGPNRSCYDGDCSDVYMVNTGLELTDIYIYNDHGDLVSAFYAEGSYGWGIEASVPDLNDPTGMTRIPYNTANTCKPGEKATEPQTKRYQ